MKRSFVLLAWLLILPLSLLGQQRGPNISFMKIEHDFGEIKEADGIAAHTFEFTNTGSAPLIIQAVNATCGCTTPTWTREPVMPGEKGKVSAAYDPKGRPGQFDKSIIVQTNASTVPVTLKITGKVIPKPLTIEDEYRYAMGPIRLVTNHVSFGTVYKNTPQAQLVGMVNTSATPAKIEFKNLPAHLKINVLDPLLVPGQTGNIEVTYLSDKQPDWDFLVDRLDLYINGKSEQTFKLIVSANIQEDFSALSPDQMAKAAKIEFEDKTFNIGTVKGGAVLSHEYKFVNSGQSDLIIRKVSASCGCTAAMPEEKVIAPGKQGSIRVSFNTTGKKGVQNMTVTVISNDPQHVREILWIKGEVTE
jgi:hypothetical protein